MLGATDGQRARFAEMLREDGHDHPDRYVLAQRRFFADVEVRGRRVLEVGSGKGLTSFFIALNGAQHVVSMEPGLAGAASAVCRTLESRIAALGLEGVELLGEDFNTWDPGGRRFDVLVSQSSINHLQESPHHAGRHVPTRQGYLAAVRKMHDLLEPGGVACVSDACRYGLPYAMAIWGTKPPWAARMSTVNWRIHQNPGTWRGIFREAGFARVEVAYPLPYRLRGFGPLAANPVANFFLDASFILRAWR